ncbi:MAG: TraR/DksA family transcriptional regulator [Thiobacillaceae bacterium]|jgi:RNA polymerase-binding protein DksA|nr:TraR/DksA family transcriptional regulator [Thiobacillaceae bacterium]
MSHLTKKNLSEIRTALGAKREALLKQIQAALEETGQTQYAEVLGRGSGDSSDEALAITLGDLSAARLDHEVRQMRELDVAMRRLEDKDFGLCVDCGAAIPAARLVANPAAVRCIACQEVHEKTYAGQEHGSI